MGIPSKGKVQNAFQTKFKFKRTLKGTKLTVISLIQKITKQMSICKRRKGNK